MSISKKGLQPPPIQYYTTYNYFVWLPVEQHTVDNNWTGEQENQKLYIEVFIFVYVINQFG